jgi:hypothetical protein
MEGDDKNKQRTASTGLFDGRVLVGCRGGIMNDAAEKRGKVIRHLEEALEIADEVGDFSTAYRIDCALDEARSRQFRLSKIGDMR